MVCQECGGSRRNPRHGTMTTTRVDVERQVVVSSQPFERVVAQLEANIGRPDKAKFMRDMATAKTRAEFERVVNAAAGASGLIEMARFDPGDVRRKETGEDSPKGVRLLIGNPLVMTQMVLHVPDAASYAPVTVLVDERPDGVHLSYDTMASCLASYGNPDALAVARDLDRKVGALLATAAA
jgi:uncharacterized protein (DUF302 family)